MKTEISKPVPPFYRNYGKATKDLFKKKFDYEHTVRVLNLNAGSLDLESGAVLGDALRGYVKTNFNGFQFGRIAAELQTDPSQENSAAFFFNNLPAGLSVSTSVKTKDNKDKAFKRPVGSLEIDYATGYFAGGLVGKSDLDVHKAEAHASVGTDSMNVGAHAVLDVSRGAEIQDLNYAVEYSQGDYVCSGYTEKNASVANFTFFQRLSPGHTLGALFKYELFGKQDRTLSIGSEYRVDPNTTVKAKVDLPTGDVSTHIEHRLAAPRALIGLASSFSLRSQTLSAQKVGLHATLGDI